MGLDEITMAAACEICVIILADGSVLDRWKVHEVAAQLRVRLMTDLLSVSAEQLASYYGSGLAKRCVVEALTPEVMKHKMDNGDFAEKVFNGRPDKLAIFFVMEISETATIDTAGEFDTELVCVLDAALRKDANHTHGIAAAIDSLIMDGLSVHIANEHRGIVQVAPHVLTLVLKDIPANIFADGHRAGIQR
jgi:hypothetical protein